MLSTGSGRRARIIRPSKTFLSADLKIHLTVVKRKSSPHHMKYFSRNYILIQIKSKKTDEFLYAHFVSCF